MPGSIICGVDDSESAKAAARVARRISARLGVGLLFVRAIEGDSPDCEVSEIAEHLQRLAGGVTEFDCSAHWLVDVGRPADRLATAAAAEGASLIIVGATGGRSAALGGVAAELAQHSPCPVMMVRNEPARAAASFRPLDAGSRRASGPRSAA